jgi:hypothetical protein
VTLGVVVSVTVSSYAKPDPVFTVTVRVEVLIPSAGRLIGLAVTSTDRGGGEKNPKASMTIFVGDALLLKTSVAAPFKGATAKF